MAPIAVGAAQVGEILPPLPLDAGFPRADAFARVVLDAMALTVGGIVELTAIGALDDMIGYHPMFRGLFRTSCAIGQDRLATPAGAAADDQPPLPVFRRLQFLIGDLGGSGQPKGARWL